MKKETRRKAFAIWYVFTFGFVFMSTLARLEALANTIEYIPFMLGLACAIGALVFSFFVALGTCEICGVIYKFIKQLFTYIRKRRYYK